MRVRETMTRHVVSVSPEDSLDEAYELMLSQDIRHLPVVEEAALIGVLSDRDILVRSTLEDGAIVVPAIPVAEAMTTDIVTCEMSTSIAEAATLMVQKKISCLPVTSAGDLVGLVTSTDLLDLLCQRNDTHSRQLLPFRFKLQRYTGRREEFAARS